MQELLILGSQSLVELLPFGFFEIIDLAFHRLGLSD